MKNTSTSIISTKRIQPARGWCATVNMDCANCIRLILLLRRTGPPVFWGKPAMLRETWVKSFYTHSLNPQHSLNTLIDQFRLSILPTLTLPSPLTHICPIPSAPSAKHTNIPQSIYSTAHTYIPQTTYWTSGYLPRGWCLCQPGGKDAWQGYLNVLGCRTTLQLHAGRVGRQQQQVK